MLVETLGEWLDGAISRNATVLDTAKDTADRATGEGYKSQCWHFAGELRGHPGFANATGSDAARVLDRHIDWNALPECDCYENVTPPRDALIDAVDFQREHGIGPLKLAVPPKTALDLAGRYPLKGVDEQGKYEQAVSICFWYQCLLSQDGWFFMSVETLGALLECSSRTASLYLRRAVRENLVEMTTECERSKRKAREYNWIGNLEIVVEEPNS
jgi:hypothetical protein